MGSRAATNALVATVIVVTVARVRMDVLVVILVEVTHVEVTHVEVTHVEVTIGAGNALLRLQPSVNRPQRFRQSLRKAVALRVRPSCHQ